MVDLKLNMLLKAGSDRTLGLINDLTKRAKETSGTFEKLSSMMSGAMSGIGKFAMGAVAAFTGLAFVSPTVQSNLARMKKPLFEIGETLGKALEPGLKIGVSLLKDFSTWLKENTWLTEGLKTAFSTIMEVASILWDKLKKLIALPAVKKTIDWVLNLELGKHIDNLVGMFGYTILGAFIGSVLGPWGAIGGAAFGLGMDIGTWINRGSILPNTSETTESSSTSQTSNIFLESLFGEQAPSVIVNINGVPGVEDVNIEEG